MATQHGGLGQPLNKDANTNRKDIDVDIPQDFHHEDTVDFENVEHENPTSLAAITRELDNLCHWRRTTCRHSASYRIQTTKTINSTFPISTTGNYQ